jgi:hypothetical protein
VDKMNDFISNDVHFLMSQWISSMTCSKYGIEM